MFDMLKKSKMYFLASVTLVYAGAVLIVVPKYFYYKLEVPFLESFGLLTAIAGLLVFFVGQINQKILIAFQRVSGMQSLGVDRIIEVSPKAIDDISAVFLEKTDVLKVVIVNHEQLRSLRSIIDRFAYGGYHTSLSLLIKMDSEAMSASSSESDRLLIFEIKSLIWHSRKNLNIQIRRTPENTPSFIVSRDYVLFMATVDPLKQKSIGIVLDTQSSAGFNYATFFNDLWDRSEAIEDYMLEA